MNLNCIQYTVQKFYAALKVKSTYSFKFWSVLSWLKKMLEINLI